MREIRLRSYPTAERAGLDAALLRDRGIPCRVENAVSGGLYAAVPAYLVVPAGRAAEAEALLRDRSEALPDGADPPAGSPDPPPPAVVSFGTAGRTASGRIAFWIAAVLLLLAAAAVLG